MSVQAIRDMIAKYTKDLDKHITPHKMRSTCGSNLYEATHDVYLVKEVLGHENVETTRRYTSVSDESRKIAASVIDF